MSLIVLEISKEVQRLADLRNSEVLAALLSERRPVENQEYAEADNCEFAWHYRQYRGIKRPITDSPERCIQASGMIDKILTAELPCCACPLCLHYSISRGTRLHRIVSTLLQSQHYLSPSRSGRSTWYASKQTWDRAFERWLSWQLGQKKSQEKSAE